VRPVGSLSLTNRQGNDHDQASGEEQEQIHGVTFINPGQASFNAASRRSGV
jgi:hypothetical protein